MLFNNLFEAQSHICHNVVIYSFFYKSALSINPRSPNMIHFDLYISMFLHDLAKKIVAMTESPSLIEYVILKFYFYNSHSSVSSFARWIYFWEYFLWECHFLGLSVPFVHFACIITLHSKLHLMGSWFQHTELTMNITVLSRVHTEQMFDKRVCWNSLGKFYYVWQKMFASGQCGHVAKQNIWRSLLGLNVCSQSENWQTVCCQWVCLCEFLVRSRSIVVFSVSELLLLPVNLNR